MEGPTSEDNIAAMLKVGPAAIETWSCCLEILEGLVRATIRAGWPEHLAREMVAAEYVARARKLGGS